MLGVELGASSCQAKHSTAELHSPPSDSCFSFIFESLRWAHSGSSQRLLPTLLKTSLLPAAFNTAKCEKLQKEKEALERRFEEELRRLGWQQQAEVQELRERLQQQFQAESARLRAEHQDQLLRMRCQHQEQVSWLAVPHW